jgi:hypothetical protein
LEEVNEFVYREGMRKTSFSVTDEEGWIECDESDPRWKDYYYYEFRVIPLGFGKLGERVVCDVFVGKVKKVMSDADFDTILGLLKEENFAIVDVSWVPVKRIDENTK